jgi:hypothetical protein
MQLAGGGGSALSPLTTTTYPTTKTRIGDIIDSSSRREGEEESKRPIKSIWAAVTLQNLPISNTAATATATLFLPPTRDQRYLGK